MSFCFNQQQLDEVFDQYKYYKMLEAVNYALKIKEYHQKLFFGDVIVNYNAIKTADNVNEFFLIINIHTKKHLQLSMELSTTQDRATFFSQFQLLEEQYLHLKNFIEKVVEQNVIRQQAVNKLTKEEKEVLGLM